MEIRTHCTTLLPVRDFGLPNKATVGGLPVSRRHFTEERDKDMIFFIAEAVGDR
jgi:hypothetical protein